MNYAGYFLIVADFIQWAKGEGIPVGPGRGSGAGSVVAWALSITDLDPLRFGLLFERFLNPERVSMPDFDIDFCQDRRDEVIRYVRDKYGAERVASIITFGKLQARAVLRDVGRALGMPYGQVDRVAKLVPFNPANPPTLEQALVLEPRLAEAAREDEQVLRLIEIAKQLEGLPRHASTHAAGVVIGDRPLDELVPLYRDPRADMRVTQFNMKDVEKAGLVKFDFLGLTTLTLLALAERLVNERGGNLQLSALPLDDPATFELLGRGETAGVFQLESGGMRDALRKLKPDCFDDIVAMNALYRPGPMDNIPRYINCKHGTEQAEYLHPLLEPILKETYGVIIYQEQVMQIARELAGYSLGGADLLRRAMGKKIKAEMDAQREVFIEGATRRAVPHKLSASIFEQVAKFASYGFPKAHATAYALLAYQTAYLKANHPLEFFAAAMTMDRANQDKLNLYRHEIAKAGIRLLPPDVNHGGATFTVEDGPRRPRDPLRARRDPGRRRAGGGRAGRGAARARALRRRVRPDRPDRRAPAQPPPARGADPRRGAGLPARQSAVPSGWRGAGAPLRQRPRRPGGERSDQPVRRPARTHAVAQAGPAAGCGLPGARPSAAGVRGARLLPLGAPSRRLSGQPGEARRHALGAAARLRRPTGQARRRGPRQAGARDGTLTLCLRAALGPERHLRGDRVRRAVGPGARSPGVGRAAPDRGRGQDRRRCAQGAGLVDRDGSMRCSRTAGAPPPASRSA